MGAGDEGLGNNVEKVQGYFGEGVTEHGGIGITGGAQGRYSRHRPGFV